MIIGKSEIHLIEVDSTNNYAAELLKENLALEGMVITAEHQTGGKGRNDNQWISEPKANLLCTIILKPTIVSIHEQFILSMMAAIALKNALTELLPGETKPLIKWPNDLIVQDKKIGGILIENTIKGSQIGSSLIGFGINVNQTHFETTNSAFLAGSLAIISKQFYIIASVKETCIRHMQIQYDKLKNFQFAEIENEYTLSLLNAQHDAFYMKNGIEIKARITGVSRSGIATFQTETESRSGTMDDWKFIRLATIH
jgi:BirA family biotin operon repressor/biotin-[acetyl-CoA-carboxylase] ligase